MLQTHKYQTNITITGSYIRQPITISYMLKFMFMLKTNKVGSVGKEIYISLTEEERQYKIYTNR
ncbi:hypothetical protein T06_2698 [Trichinella sp. T6]|nr:hypothetical protein T06_2698 [Trichinella sp. T6]